MKIAIYGDSYAAPTPHNDFHFVNDMWDKASWTYILKQHHTVKNFAKAGTCIWYSFEWFQKTFQEFDAIIFAWTDFTRVPVDAPFEGYSATLSHPAALAGYLKRNDGDNTPFKQQVRTFLTKSNEVFPWLFSKSQQQFVAEKCFLDVQQLCRVNNKRLINICAFEDHDTIPNIFAREHRAGPMLTALQKVSDLETRIKDRDNKPFFDNRSNHLFPVNNNALFQLVNIRLLDATINNIYNCQHSTQFQYHEEDWNAYFSA